MTLNINIPQPILLKPKISVFGIGGAGGNALNNMIKSNLEGVEFIAANTDAQALSNSLASERIQLGVNLTKGLGAGSFPDHGRVAAEENIDEIVECLQGNNMAFITAGMGGGTGTGAAPVVAKLAKERDILTVGVITKPFHFEGKYRMEIAEAGIEELKKYVDTLIIIPNQNLFRIANEQTTFESAFKMADHVLHAGVRGVTDLITMPGLVNLDFADIRTIMTKMGKAMMGTGEAEGEDRAVNACKEAVSNPLLDDISIKGAKGVLVNMTGGPDMTLFEADVAVNTIRKEVDSNANIIFGSAFNEDMKGKIRISVVATGIEDETASQNISNANLASENISGASVIDPANNLNLNSKKTFFDPGIPNDPNQNLEEIGAEDFKPHKILQDISNSDIVKKSINNFDENSDNIKEENIDLQQGGSVEIEQTELRIDNCVNDVFREGDQLNKDSGEASKLEEELKKPEKKKQDSKKTKSKKEGGGFSLFNFMNSSKSKAEKKSEDKDQEVPVSISDNEESENVNIVQKQKTNSNHDKVNQTPDLSDFISEDDILNVPALFRRKK